jgi:hypothetical protein
MPQSTAQMAAAKRKGTARRKLTVGRRVAKRAPAMRAPAMRGAAMRPARTAPSESSYGPRRARALSTLPPSAGRSLSQRTRIPYIGGPSSGRLRQEVGVRRYGNIKKNPNPRSTDIRPFVNGKKNPNFMKMRNRRPR